ncbi:MAG: Gfo/Idh/MocA family oxidoreductase [Clostridiaceae bacterium]|nr:Gfo/Idh/MocA family oxidoreductase [Clostridiaceae bacterium]
MNRKIRIGLIGAGNIAQNAHIPAYLKQDDIELTAVYDLNAARTQEVAQRYSIAHACASLDEFCSLKDVDAVSVCTWNNAHAVSAIAAANAGKHVLCEKPMAMTVAEAEAMKAAAAKNGVVFMMGFVNRFREDAQYIRHMAEAGKFGDIYYANASLRRRRGTPLGWFTDTAKSGGGPVIDIGVHLIDLTWFMMGKPEPLSVSAATHYKIGDYQTKGVSRWEAFDKENLVFNTEDSAAGLIRFANGATMNFEVSWAINGAECGLCSSLYGDQAGATLDPLAIYGEDGGYLTDNKPTVQQAEIFDKEIRHFIDCVKTGSHPLSPAADGVQVQRMLNGIYASAKAGQEIKI